MVSRMNWPYGEVEVEFQCADFWPTEVFMSLGFGVLVSVVVWPFLFFMACGQARPVEGECR